MLRLQLLMLRALFVSLAVTFALAYPPLALFPAKPDPSWQMWIAWLWSLDVTPLIGLWLFDRLLPPFTCRSGGPPRPRKPLPIDDGRASPGRFVLLYHYYCMQV